MTDFSTKGHVVEEKEYVSPYIKPGIHVAKITQVEPVESQGGTLGLKFIHETKPVEGLDGKGQIAETTWWVSESAWPYTKDRLVIMADKLEVRDALDNFFSGIQDYSELTAKIKTGGISSVFVGKAARWKFAGEEIEGKMNEETGEKKANWWKSLLASFGFCESLSVPEEDSKLKFDENNKYDMKRLVTTDVETVVSQNGTAAAQEADDTWS